MTSSSRLLALILAAALTATACHRNPEVRAREALARGDAYLAQHKIREATIEYRNAVQAQPARADAHYKLAKAYAEAGDPIKAYEEYSRAADLDPSNVDAQLNAGTLLLMGGEFGRARTRAELALKAQPNSAPARILLGNALAGLKDMRRAVAEMEQAIALDPSYAPAYAALGAVQFVRGGRDDARASFEKAVQLAPKSVEARLAFANFQWAMGDAPATERELKAALAIDSSNPLAHRMLALFYLAARRAPEAEPHFKALAAASPDGTLALADYYSGMGRRDDALAVLKNISGDAARVRQARLRMAALHDDAGRPAEAQRIVDELIKQQPQASDAHILKARLLLRENGDLGEAQRHAQAAVQADANSAAAQYTAGLVALARRDFDAAENAFEQVVQINPRAAAAQLQLARLQLAKGNTAGALKAAEDAAKTNPDDSQTAVVLARSLRATGDLERARRELTARLAKMPGNVPMLVELGWVELSARQIDASRAAFERALEHAPDLEDARVGAVAGDVAAHDLDNARERVNGWLRQDAHDAVAQILAARLDLFQKQPAAAEQRLRDVVQRTPSRLDAYEMLGQIYLQQGQLDRALAEYSSLAQRSQAVGPATMVAMIKQQKGDRDGARAQYEHVLQIDARAGVAANNLAWMNAEDGRLDEAVRLATVAADVLKDRAEAQDTLGWVYLRKDLPVHAVPALARAVELAPSNALYHHHLGQAYAKSGDAPRARGELQRAIALGLRDQDAEQAKEVLATLR